MLKDFRQFILRGNLVDLAVAVGELPDQPLPHRAARGRTEHAQMSRMPERDPDRGAPLRVLHGRGGRGLAVLVVPLVDVTVAVLAIALDALVDL